MSWGLREGWRDFHDGSEHGMLTWISERVTKGSGGNPTVEAARLLFEKISRDPGWFPGKLYGTLEKAFLLRRSWKKLRWSSECKFLTQQIDRSWR